jgi:hypothetical protein
MQLPTENVPLGKAGALSQAGSLTRAAVLPAVGRGADDREARDAGRLAQGDRAATLEVPVQEETGEMRKLGYSRFGRSSVVRILKRHGLTPERRPNMALGWLQFLAHYGRFI